MKILKTNKSFDAYLDEIASDKREVIVTLNTMISKVFKNENCSLWEGVFWGGSAQQIVGYGQIPFSEETPWFTVGIAAQKKGYSLYFNPTIDGQYIIKKYSESIGKAKLSSGCISFTKLENLNLDVIREMIDVSYRYWQNVVNN